MAFHEETFHLDIDEDIAGVPEVITAFYTHNGYITESADEAAGKYIFVRGKTGAGWWSSNMTELHTAVTVEISATKATIDYRINISGQRLLDEDRAFWKKEARALAASVEQGAELVDLRPQEALRAQNLAKDLRSSGLWYGVAAFVAIMVALFVANFLGS